MSRRCAGTRCNRPWRRPPMAAATGTRVSGGTWQRTFCGCSTGRIWVTRDEAPERTGAEILLEALVREGVDTIFGYPGGANLPIYQHLPEHPRLKHILVRHEQGAAHMADGYARASGRPGVVFATSGP